MGNSGVLRIRIEDNPDIWLSTLSANTLYFIQFTVVGDTTTSTSTGFRWAPARSGRNNTGTYSASTPGPAASATARGDKRILGLRSASPGRGLRPRQRSHRCVPDVLEDNSNAMGHHSPKTPAGPVETTIGPGMKIRLLTGDAPANCAATETGTLICEITCPSNYFDAAVNGIMAKTGTWSGTASAIGVIGYARFLNNDGSVVHGQAVMSQAVSLLTSAATPANSITLTFASTAGVDVGRLFAAPASSRNHRPGRRAHHGDHQHCQHGRRCMGTRIYFGDTSGDTHLNVIDITAVAAHRLRRLLDDRPGGLRCWACSFPTAPRRGS